MHIKRYKGHRLPDVMRQVREDLGEEAVILHTKAGAARGVRRLIGAADGEGVAAGDEPAPAPGPAPHAAGARALPSALAPMYDRLIGRGLDAVLSVRLLEGLVADDGVDTVEARLAALIDVGESVLPPRAATLAVVGPSGAGKTTVVAKLAV